MHSVSIGNEVAVNLALATLKESAIPQEDGTWKITVSAQERFANEILSNLVIITPKIPDRTLRGLVYRSVFKWLRFKKYREDPKPHRGFQGALLREIRRIERNCSDFHVLMFINCKPNDLAEFDNSNVAGIQINIRDWGDLDQLHADEFWQTIKLHKLSPSLFHDFDNGSHFQRRLDFTPIVVSLNTFDSAAAVELAQGAFDLFRVCINLPVISGRFSYFRSARRALSPVLPTPVYGVFSGDGNFITVFTTTESHDYEQVKVKDRHIQAVRSYLEKVNRISTKEIGERIIRCLHLYQDAIDIHSPRQSYLALWHVLEGIADITASEIPQREIAKRIKTLLGTDPIINQLIQVLVDRRNKLVHAGEFPDDPDPLFFALKLIVDAALFKILQLAEKLDTSHHIEEFLSLSPLGNSVLERKLEVIKFIQDSRDNDN